MAKSRLGKHHVLLKGLKVVEFASYIAGPGTACILGDWGADVIKVERPGGDSMRHIFADLKTDLGANPTFDLDNRGKRGVVLDTSKPQGREALARLAGTADVFLTNVRPAALRRAGLDDVTLRAANPRLVYAVITGYGLEGPDAHKPGFDVTAFWARAGVANMTAPKGADPFMLRSGFGDHITALATVSAILAALYEREQTGEGRLVQTSLLATGVYTVGSDLAVQLKFGKLASNRPRDRPLNPLATFYKSADGRWFVHNPRGGTQDWAHFATVAGRPDLIDDERFATGKARREHSPCWSQNSTGPSGPWLSTRSPPGSTPPTWSGRRSRPPPRWPRTRRSWHPGPSCRSRTARAGPTPRRPPRPASQGSTPPSVRSRRRSANTPARCWASSATRKPRSRRSSRRAPRLSRP